MESETVQSPVHTFRVSGRHFRTAAIGMGIVMTVLVLVVTGVVVREWNGLMAALIAGLIATIWFISVPLGYLLAVRLRRGLELHIGPDGMCRQHGAVRQIVPWSAVTRIRVLGVDDRSRQHRSEILDRLQQEPRLRWLAWATSWIKPGPREPISVDVYTAEGRALWLMEFERLAEIAELIAAGVGPGIPVDRG
jgi:hypothetical protein